MKKLTRVGTCLENLPQKQHVYRPSPIICSGVCRSEGVAKSLWTGLTASMGSAQGLHRPIIFYNAQLPPKSGQTSTARPMPGACHSIRSHNFARPAFLIHYTTGPLERSFTAPARVAVAQDPANGVIWCPMSSLLEGRAIVCREYQSGVPQIKGIARAGCDKGNAQCICVRC